MVGTALDDLLATLCQQCALAATPEALLAGTGFSMHGVWFYLQHSEAWPELLTIYCEFGALPPALHAQACQALLEANLVLAHQTAMQQGFAVDPASAAVVAMVRLPLAGLEVQGLREWLADLAEQAMAWRADYFLDPQAQGVSPPAAPPHWLARSDS